jgi:hypothetical protein
MTSDELRRKYEAAYKIMRNEQRMRAYVFPPGHQQREQKLGEMETLMQIVAEFKDALKPHCEGVMEQQDWLQIPGAIDDAGD